MSLKFPEKPLNLYYNINMSNVFVISLEISKNVGENFSLFHTVFVKITKEDPKRYRDFCKHLHKVTLNCIHFYVQVPVTFFKVSSNFFLNVS